MNRFAPIPRRLRLARDDKIAMAGAKTVIAARREDDWFKIGVGSKSGSNVETPATG